MSLKITVVWEVPARQKESALARLKRPMIVVPGGDSAIGSVPCKEVAAADGEGVCTLTAVYEDAPRPKPVVKGTAERTEPARKGQADAGAGR